MPDTVAFVDSITTGASTRLDLNDGTSWGLSYAGTDLSPPPLRRAVAQTLLSDGARIPASAYDNRTLTLRLDSKAASVDASATAVQALMRELDRPINYLKWQPQGATNPVFFQTFRSDTNRISEYPGTGTFKSLDVRVLAAPFAYGVEESPGSITFNADPAAGNWYADVTNVKGDVETPLTLRLSRNFAAVAARQTVFAVRRSAAGFTMTGVLQAEAMTLGTDAALAAAGGSFSPAAGNNVARISFATATLSQRLFGNVFSATGTENRGRYRVYARVKKSVGGDGMALQLRWGTLGIAQVSNDLVTLPSTSSIVWVDLGDTSVPYGADPVTSGFSGVEVSVTGGYVEVWAERTSGAGTLDIDMLAVMPASDQLTLLQMPAHGDATGPRLIWDGPQGVVYLATATEIVRDTDPTPIVGGTALMVSPGVTNRIFNLREVTPGTGSSLATTTYDLRYYPRYLYVRPATT